SQIFSDLIGFDGRNDPSDSKRGHEPYGPNTKLRGLNNFVIAKNADLEAAAAEIGNAAQGRFGAERSENRFASEARFLLRADDFEANSGFLPDAANKNAAVFCFA